MRRTRQTNPRVETLEGRALLSGIQAAGVHSAAVEIRQTGNTMGNALPNSDVQALQQLASANNLVTFFSQLALLKDNRTGIDSGAMLILDDSRDLDLQLNNLASSHGTVAPSDLQGMDQAIAENVVSKINTRSFLPVFQAAWLQSGSRLIGQLQQVSTSAQSPELQTIAQTFLPIARADLMNLLSLMRTAVPTASAPQTSPSSSMLSGSDVQTLESSYSVTLMEKFLAQLTALETKRSGVDQYAEKLVQDHEQETIQLGNYALATNTFLPANFQGQQVSTALHVLGFANTARYDHNYLTTMVQSHTQDIMDNKMTIATTTNPNLKQFAMDDLPTDWLHRQGAAALLQHVRP